MVRKRFIASLFALALVSSCGGQSEKDEPLVNGMSVSELRIASHVSQKKAAELISGAQWHVFQVDRAPFFVAISESSKGGRMILPRVGRGYQAREIRLLCHKGDFAVISAFAASHDNAMPYAEVEKYPGFDLRPSVEGFCRGEGMKINGEVDALMHQLRPWVLRALKQSRGRR